MIYVINFHLPQGALKNLYIQLWSSPKTFPSGFLLGYECVNMLSLNVVILKIYQWHVKTLLSLKQIMSNHTLYIWPCLKCSLLSISLLLAFYLSPFVFPTLRVYRQDGFSYSSHRYRSHQRKSKPCFQEDEWYGNYGEKLKRHKG